MSKLKQRFTLLTSWEDVFCRKKSKRDNSNLPYLQEYDCRRFLFIEQVSFPVGVSAHTFLEMKRDSQTERCDVEAIPILGFTLYVVIVNNCTYYLYTLNEIRYILT